MSANQTHNSKVIAIAAWCVQNGIALDTDHTARYQHFSPTDFDLRQQHMQRIAEFLFRANIDALHTRYPDLKDMAPDDENNIIYQQSIDVLKAHALTDTLTPQQTMYCIREYDYQTCELDDYETTKVFGFLRSVAYAIAVRLCDTARPDSGGWLSDDDDALRKFEADAKEDGTTGPVSLLGLVNM